MEAFYLTITPLILTGLGIITYKHPPLARLILYVLFVLACAYGISVIIYYFGQLNAYTKSIDATAINIYQPNEHNVNFDSLKTKLKNYDSIKQVMALQRVQMEADQLTLKVKESILNSISSLRKTSDAKRSILMNVFWIIFLTIVVFYILSYVFDNIWKSKDTKEDKILNQTSDE